MRSIASFSVHWQMNWTSSGHRLQIFTCWVSCACCCCSSSYSSVPQMGGPCHYRSAHPETKSISVNGFPLKWYVFKLTEVEVFSYIRGGLVLARQMLKSLQCGHAPHVTAQIGFRLKKQVGNRGSHFLSIFLVLFLKTSILEFIIHDLSSWHLCAALAHSLFFPSSFFFLPQVCDCKRTFFEGLTAIAFSSHKRSQRNIILPILLKRKYELGAF